MKITKINGEDFSLENLHKAVAATKNNKPLEFETEFSGATQTYKINYNGGERYAHLERDTAKTDYLSEIIKPLALRHLLMFHPDLFLHLILIVLRINYYPKGDG